MIFKKLLNTRPTETWSYFNNEILTINDRISRLLRHKDNLDTSRSFQNIRVNDALNSFIIMQVSKLNQTKDKLIRENLKR